MQFPGQGKPAVGIVFDSDMGNRIDTALAMALLYGLDGKNESRVVSVSVSKSNLKSAALCEAIGRFYAGAVNGGFAAFGRTLPVGMADDGRMADDTPMFSVLAKKDDKGAPVYQHGIHTLVDTAEVPALIRNAFTSQQDNNAIVVLAGPATNLARTLALPNVKDLVKSKVRYLVISGGGFPGGDIAAARKLLAEWPGPLVFSGPEVGASLPYPAESIEKDFAWSPNHPVADAYRAYKQMPYDAPSWDMTAVLYAIRPKENYFKLSEPGAITVLDDGRTKFTPSATGLHRYLIADPAQKEKILKVYIEIARAKPVVRQSRFRSQQKKEADPAKPAEVKPPAAKP
jgi:inosine-uridine nucleoside N-ribohydrolase